MIGDEQNNYANTKTALLSNIKEKKKITLKFKFKAFTLPCNNQYCQYNLHNKDLSEHWSNNRKQNHLKWR